MLLKKALELNPLLPNLSKTYQPLTMQGASHSCHLLRHSSLGDLRTFLF